MFLFTAESVMFIVWFLYGKYDLLHFPIENNVLYPYTGITSGMCAPCTWGASPSSTPRGPTIVHFQLQPSGSSWNLSILCYIFRSLHCNNPEIGPQCPPLSVPPAKGLLSCITCSWRNSAQWLSSFIGIVQKRELEIKEWRDLKVSEGNKCYKYGDFVVVTLYHWWNLLCISNSTALFWGWWLFL